MQTLNINPTLMECVIAGTAGGLSMTGIKPEAVGVSRFFSASKELSVIVGLHGRNNGNMTMNLSEKTAVFLTERLLGESLTEINDVTVDAICELGNMIAGQFHKKLINTPFAFKGISLPALIFGANYNLYHLKNIETVSVTFEIQEISVVKLKDKFFSISISLLNSC